MRSEPMEVVGPYEHWAFGAGAVYDGPRTRGERDRYFAVTADRPPHPEPGTEDTAAVDAEPRLIPMITWRPASEGAPSMFPMLLDARRKSGQATGGPATGAIAYRKSARIVTSTVNPLFAAQRIDRRVRDDRRAVAPQVLMAVIDDGIPFAHRNLADSRSRSRIEFCWLQGLASPEEERQTVPFGWELTGGDIDDLRARYPDEDALYATFAAREAGMPAPSSIARSGSHGAHVLDAAAGHRHGSRSQERPVGERGDLDELGIIAVQLPAASLLDSAAFGKDALILGALHYVFDRADRLAEKLLGDGRHFPLVINFSFGFTGGPHGGRDRLERAIGHLIRRRRERGGVTELIMPSGNSFGSALLAKIEPKSSRETVSFRWRVQPNDHTPNFLELWLPRGATFDGLSLTVIDPRGRVGFRSALLNPGSRSMHAPILPDGVGREVGQVSRENYDLGDGETQARVVLVLAPTEPDDPTLPAAASGSWTVSIDGTDAMSGPVVCRIQRDEAPFAYIQGARQSYLDDPFDRRFEPTGAPPFSENPPGSIVRLFGTINGLATHDAVVVVGGFQADTGLPAPYSAAGTRDVTPASPGSVVVSSASDSASCLGGILGAGTRTGSVRRLNGTSVAAPQVARTLALALCRQPRPPSIGSVPSVAMGLLGEHIAAPDELGIIDRPGWVGDVPTRLGKGLLKSSIAFGASP